MKVGRYWVVSAVVGFVLAGCGGSGGGGTSGATLTYNTDWTGAPGDAVETVTIYNGANVQVAQQALTSALGSTLNFRGLPSGSLHVKAVMTSGSTELGRVETNVSSSPFMTLNTVYTGTTANVTVTPSNTTVAIDGSVQLSASSLTSADFYIFKKSSDYSWSISGSAATLNSSTGVVTGVSTGVVTVTATDGTKSGTSTVSVVSDTPVRGKWTIMVYLNAANSLYPYAQPNINQMLQAAYNPDVRFVVQWKQFKDPTGVNGSTNPSFEGTRRYLLQHDSATSTSAASLIQDLGTSVDMGSPATLTNFVSWAQTKYPADHYVLILWSHGNGWRSKRVFYANPTRGITYDEQSGNHIATYQLANALGSSHIDILGFDACLMQMLEVGYGLQGNVDYMAASEDLVPAAGYPYNKVFKPFADNPDDTPANLSKNFVTAMTSTYTSGWNIQESVIDMSKIGALATAIDTFGTALLNDETSFNTLMPAVRSASFKFGETGDGYYFYDLADIATRIKNTSVVPSVKSSADSVLTAVDNAILWNGTLAGDTSNPYHGLVKGIAIDFEAKLKGPPASTGVYLSLPLARDTSWDAVLQAAP